ncbi:transposase [Peptoniphilus raoultii]|uniref:transposase n=1 Tax=Peptoniphilus raoultii TaxID=1776387 RepID=UPI0008D8EDCE|nr:transposase [Peptoniphilus raoultii]
MKKTPRQYAESGIYHIYVRGNNKEYIFKTKEEKETYLKIITEAREKYKFKILAYAIMDNHAHILLKIENEKLSKAMQNIQQKYTYYYNKKYKRTGRVFQGRYNSKACGEDEYLLEVIKYIHQNPEKAGLDQKFTFEFTSHKNYITDEKGIVDADYVLGILNPDFKKAREIYLDYLKREE